MFVFCLRECLLCRLDPKNKLLITTDTLILVSEAAFRNSKGRKLPISRGNKRLDGFDMGSAPSAEHENCDDDENGDFSKQVVDITMPLHDAIRQKPRCVSCCFQILYFMSIHVRSYTSYEIEIVDID